MYSDQDKKYNNNNNNNKFIYSPISHRVQWTVQKLKHNISTYVRNIIIKENHKNSTINEHSEEDKVSQETHEHAKDHSHQIQPLRVSCRGVLSAFS